MNQGILRNLLLLLVTVTPILPVWAAAPATGIVYEGVSAPGLALGDSRANSTVAYGEPNYCQSVEVAGDNASCAYAVEGGGQVTIRFRGADGGNAGNDNSDVVHSIRWFTGVDWITSVGVTTQLALEEPEALVAAYPEAEVIYHSLTGEIYRVVDTGLGIDITRVFDFYTGTITVHMSIFKPIETDPEPEPGLLAVNDIDLSAIRVGAVQREITGIVEVVDGDGLPGGGARVRATWTLANGSTQAAEAVTTDDGVATFELDGRMRRGYYTLEIDDVVLDEYEFDADNSTLSARVYAR